MKKFFAILLAAIMMLSMAAFATEVEGDTPDAPTATVAPDVNIDDDLKEEDPDTDGETSNTYTAYQLFKVQKVANDETKMAYYIENTDANEKLIKELQDNQKQYVTLIASADGTRYNVTWANDTDADDSQNVKDFADKMKTFVEKEGNFNGLSYTWTGESQKTVDPGYYLIVSNLGTNLVLATTKIDIFEKNEYPGVTKDVSPATQEIGSDVTYTVEVTIPTTAVAGHIVTVHDTIEAGLTVDTTSVSAKIQDTTTSVTTTPSAVANGAFTIDFTVSEAMLGKVVEITYTATVNSAAEIFNDSEEEEGKDKDKVNKNVVYITYAGYKSVEDDADVKTFEINMTKIDGATKAELTGAEFQLITKTTETKGEGEEAEEIETVTVIDLIEAKDGEYRPVMAGEEAAESIEIGEARIYGLAAGTYYLRETKAPEGYNLLKDDVKVEIDAQGNVKVNGAAVTPTEGEIDFKVENNTGSELPSTGGIGTTIFYVVGGLMMAAALVLLVSKRKVSASK